MKKSVMGLCFAADTSALIPSGAAGTGCACGSIESVGGTTVSLATANTDCPRGSAVVVAGMAVSCDCLKTQKVDFPVSCSDAFNPGQRQHRIKSMPARHIPLDHSRICI